MNNIIVIKKTATNYIELYFMRKFFLEITKIYFPIDCSFPP